MTNNWTSSIFKGNENSGLDIDGVAAKKSDFWTTKFGDSAGIDPRAREIEKRLGL